jgi:hypothetical protein
MKFKTFITIFLVLGVCSALIYACQDSGNAGIQSVLAAAPQVTAQPSATLTASPVPSPTLDILMTAQVLSNDALRKVAEARVIEANALGTQQSAVSTVQAANLAVLQLTATLAEQNRQVGIINMTIQAGNVAQANANADYLKAQTDQMKVKATWTAEAPARDIMQSQALIEIEQKQKQAGWVDTLYFIGIPLAVFAILIILFLAYKIARNWIGLIIDQRQYWRFNDELQRNPPETVNEAMPAQADPVVVQHTEPNNGFMNATQYELPAKIDREKIGKVADAIIGGAAFSRSALVDTKIMTDGEWDSLRWWMARREYARPINATIQNSPWFVTMPGQRFFEAMATTPPLA